MTKFRTRAIQLSIGEANDLPTEFRLFVQGWNETENGRYLFDADAAKAVMSAYQQWGVDLAIDLEHQMLDGDAGPDPTARDARGWCSLELRSDGSLWAVNVRWTPDGAERLSQKRQRYISPAFEIDPNTDRVTKILNIAITAMPATHRTPALVAASYGASMDPSLVKQALDAVEKGDAKSALEILKGLIASAAGAEASPDGDDAGSEGDGAEGVAPPAEAESVEKPKVIDSSATPPPSDDSDDEDDEDNSDKPAKKAARKAMLAMLKRETGTKTLAEALSVVQSYKASHLTLEHERQKLSKERAVLESAERRQLCTDLVKIGAEFPATVWADSTSKKPVALKPRWAAMPIAELRNHVAEQKAARGTKTVKLGVQPAQGAAAEGLTPEQLAICEESKCDPKIFAQLRAFRDSGKAA